MRTHFLAAPIACLALPAMAASALNAPTDVAEIKAFEQKNAEQRDSVVLAKTYAPDAVVLDYMTGAIYRGRQAIEEAFGGCDISSTPLRSAAGWNDRRAPHSRHNHRPEGSR